MVSRIINNPLDALLELSIPASLPSYFIIEAMFYSFYDNSLASSVVIESTDEDILTYTTLNYTNTTPSTQRRLMFINLAKLSSTLEMGRFRVVLNFFVPEIGTYNEGQFSVTRVSPSRTEVELRLLPQCKSPNSVEQLRQFAAPQINLQWVDSALAQIFNQPNTAVPNSTSIPTDRTKLTFEIITGSLPPVNSALLANENTPISFKTTVKTQTQILLDSAYGIARGRINTLKTNGTLRFTDLVLKDIVSGSIAEALKTYTQVPGVILK
jgi:hypothetical protein